MSILSVIDRARPSLRVVGPGDAFPHRVPANQNAPSALLIVDVQKRFYDATLRGTAATEKMAERLEAIIPHFRAAGLAIYHIYYGDEDEPLDQIGFKCAPKPGEIVVAKDDDSAFAGSDIHDDLKGRGHKSFYACGLNRSYCLGETILHGREKGYDVTVLQDVIENGQVYEDSPAAADLEKFRQAEIKTCFSEEVLRRLSLYQSLSLA